MFKLLFGIILILIPQKTYSEEINYNYFYDKLEINDTANFFSQNLTVVKLDEETFQIDGRVEQHVDTIDDTWMIEVILYNRDEDLVNYKKFFHLPKMGACQFMAKYYKKYIYETLSKHSNAPHYKECPFKSKVYNITNYPFKFGKFKEFVKPGYFRVDGNLYQSDDSFVSSYKVYLHVE